MESDSTTIYFIVLTNYFLLRYMKERIKIINQESENF